MLLTTPGLKGQIEPERAQAPRREGRRADSSNEEAQRKQDECKAQDKATKLMNIQLDMYIFIQIFIYGL